MESKRITSRDFFMQPAEELAPALLGKILCHRVSDERGNFVIRSRISVTEAYCENDPVNDAVRAEKKEGKTSQHKIGGHLYVKSQRGRCRFDIVANKENIGEGVLIRGLDAYNEGPFIAADVLDIKSDLDGVDLLDPKGEIWLECDSATIITGEPTCRVLGEKAPESSKEMLLRFTIKEIKFNN